jgi:hypothetical protein
LVASQPQPEEEPVMPSHTLTIRTAAAADCKRLAELAALDSAPVPEHPVLLAEAAGRPVAAVSLGGGAAIADPFEPTADALALLELRARQLAKSAWRRLT